MNILFVCTANRLRSATAEHIFKDIPGFVVKSAGTDKWVSVKPLDAHLMDWAEKVFVMQRNHVDFIKKHFRGHIHKVVCLNIPDIYDYMDKELIDILKIRMEEFLVSQK